MKSIHALRVGLCALAVWLFTGPQIMEAAQSASPVTVAATIRINQTRASTPEVIAYLDIRAEGGMMVEADAGQIQAEIGPYPATALSLQPFAATGEPLATILLVDISKSLPPDRFAQIRQGLQQWIEMMGEKDRTAIVTFGETVKTLQDFSADKNMLKQRVEELALTDRHTRLHDGLVRALDLGRRADDGLPRRRVIVVLSDGLDDAAGGRSREETLARIKEEPVPVYAIGFAGAGVSSREKEEGFKALGIFARESGGEMVVADAKPLNETYAAIRTHINQARVLTMTCPTCPGDGRSYPLHVRLQADNRVLTTSSEVRLTPGAPPPPSPVEPSSPLLLRYYGLPLWGWVVGGLSLIIIGAIVFVRRRNKLELTEAPDSELSESEMEIAPGTDEESGMEAAVNIDTPSPAEALPGIPILLTVVSGLQRGQSWRIEVGEEAVIGRSPHCAVVIEDDSEISGRHCALSSLGGLLFIHDLGSTNGTIVNGAAFSGRRRLDAGDMLLVGRTELRLMFDEVEK